MASSDVEVSSLRIVRIPEVPNVLTSDNLFTPFSMDDKLNSQFCNKSPAVLLSEYLNWLIFVKVLVADNS